MSITTKGVNGALDVFFRLVKLSGFPLGGPLGLGVRFGAREFFILPGRRFGLSAGEVGIAQLPFGVGA